MKKIFLIGFLGILLFPLVSFAGEYTSGGKTIKYEGLVPCGKSQAGPGESPEVTMPCQFCHFFIMIKGWIDRTLSFFVPVLAGLMIAIGGFMIIISYSGGLVSLEGGKKGGPVLLARAKKLFSAVIFGLLIIYGAWIIVNTFFQIIGVQDWTGLKEGWWQIKCEII